MPRYRKSRLPDGWQIADRDDGHWLQRREADGAWRDYAGPYKQRGSAYDRWRRDEASRILRLRNAMVKSGGEHEHEWVRDYDSGTDDGVVCVLCLTKAPRAAVPRRGGRPKRDATAGSGDESGHRG